ncbi:MAG: hypothetical protein ACJ76B_12750 [Solirubrobacterales bacterium]
MSRKSLEGELRRHVEGIEHLRPDPDRVRVAMAAASSGAVARRRWTPLATALACLVLGGAVATAATGLLDPALDSFLHGGKSPGRQLSGKALPSWLRPAPHYNAPEEVSVVAASGKERLLAYRQRGWICFDYGHHAGECLTPRDWRKELQEAPWILRGPLGRSVWFGLVDASVALVRVEYREGGTTDVLVRNGGFVLDADRDRDPQRLLALDASGAVVAEQPIDD